MIEPIFKFKIRKGGIACPQPPPPGRGRKVKGVQTKKDVYNCVQMKYKRLTHFRILNQKRGGWRHTFLTNAHFHACDVLLAVCSDPTFFPINRSSIKSASKESIIFRFLKCRSRSIDQLINNQKINWGQNARKLNFEE